MKIIVIQEAGRHEANRNYRECLSLQRAFIFNGHSCDVWGLGHPNYNQIPDWDSYDLIFNIENYDYIGWVPDLSFYKKPKKILWSIDAHCRGEGVYESTFETGRYDYLLHSSHDFVKKPYHIWFPNSFDDDLIKNLESTKTHFLGFCGNYVNRKELLDRLSSKWGLKQDIFVIGDSMVRTINEYKIHFNKNIFNDINYRNFETIGSGTALLTNFHLDYERLGFIHNHNCLLYKNENEIDSILGDLLHDDERIKRISKNGLEFSKSHTYKIRVKQLIEKI